MPKTVDQCDRLSEEFDKMADFEVSVAQMSNDKDENERSQMLLREEFRLNDTISKE